MKPLAALVLLTAAAVAVPAGAATAATFGPATPVAGFGDQPAQALLDGSAIDPAGRSVLVGTASTANTRHAVVAPGAAGAAPGPALATGAAGAYDLDVAHGDGGRTAVAFTVGHTAWLTLCAPTACASPLRVGGSALKPEPAVAVEPATGRTIVLWRGRTAGGRNRLQWRITTADRLGPTHTLGEFGDTPRVGTDATGRTIAVWSGSRKGDGPDTGLRTTARHTGEFLRPRSITTAPVADVQLATGAGGTTIAAWLTAPGGVDIERPVGTVQVATRTTATAFGTPRDLGIASTVRLAASADGHAIVVADRHVNELITTITVARRAPGGAFGPLTGLGPQQIVSDAFPATGAIDDAGNAVVAWASVAAPDLAVPGGVLAASTGAGGAFGAPDVLAPAATINGAGPTTVALGAGVAQVAWVGKDAVAVARAPLG